MGGEVKELKWGGGVVAVVVVLLLLNLQLDGVEAASRVPCYFIFGDSLVDNGNNNNMASLAKANYRPYGIDFPSGPTGRFSNGKTAVDTIAARLGFKGYIPPYATTRGRALLQGVNYASAAAGIREETGRQLGARITMRGQVINFGRTVREIERILGKSAAANRLGKCIYTVGLGSNDYLNNYFMPAFYRTSRQYTPQQFADVLIRNYSLEIRNMYRYGARKIAMFGVGPIGCSPNELAQYSPDGKTCVKRINDACQLFNNRLRSLADQLNRQYPKGKFTYLNDYGVFQDLLSNPSRYGFRVTNKGCCGVGRNNGQVTCLPNQIPCPNRRDHVFWDAFHPTEIVNDIIANRSFIAQKSTDVHPFDIRRLAQL